MMDKRWKFDPGPLADSIAAHAEACGLTRAQMLRVMVYAYGPAPEVPPKPMTYQYLDLLSELMEKRKAPDGPTTGPTEDPGPGPSSGKELGYNREFMKDWLTNDKLRLTFVDEEGRRTDKDGNPKSGPTTGPPVDPDLGPDDPDRAFALFWSAYPRKVGKGDAIKAWRQTYKVRPDALHVADRAHLLGLRVKDKNLIPYPATWLRRHGWEDNLDDVADGSGPMTEREKRAAAGGDPEAKAPERKRFDNPYGEET